MSGSVQQGRGASPFSRGGMLAVLVVGFSAFIAMLYFLAIGDTGERDSGGAAHAAADGINGYSGLVDLLKASGYAVEQSRGREGLETTDLLVLTPPPYTDAEEFAEVLQNREYLGPTLVILPKWSTSRPTGEVAEPDRDRVQDDWVNLISANPVGWTSELPEPFTFEHEIETLDSDDASSWSGLDLAGTLPTRQVLYTTLDSAFEPVVTNAAGQVLAMDVVGDPGTEYYENAHWTTFVVEPDLMNNYGMADPTRAALAMKIVEQAGYGDMTSVTFDLTLNGYGASTNLLTLAFRPPFLAATLCLILAMLIVGWRAFLRFGPAVAPVREIAFGKSRLVKNGAGLIVRARRLGLLAEPYVALVERRLARSMGIARPDEDAIDAALARRLPGEEPFSSRAARLREASKPMDILRAAKALNDLTDKTSSQIAKEPAK